ncbi:MAG TPA: methionine adenosyltransferase [Trueperaceae bacterium]|nr:methionine adenosyltransferase [Trueperaceae bacterium]
MARLVSAESVTEGHPDKLADRISDSVLDAILAQDPSARVAVETLLTKGLALVAGEVTTSADVDVQACVREAAREVGYTDAAYGFDADHSAVLIALSEQSPDIARGVNAAIEADSGDHRDAIGAGDQGLMFGYAIDETPELMPLPITLAHRMARRLAEVRRSGELPYLRPDGKTQVTLVYEDGVATALETVVLSAQHHDGVEAERMRQDLVERVIEAVLPEGLDASRANYLVNPTGRFVEGGPAADAGLTGRKIIVDTYGGAAPHGGGAFSGKDPTKVDRSGSYFARYIAKNVVAAGLARRCQVQLAYAIGVARPVGMYVDTFGTGVVPDDRLIEAIRRTFDGRPAALIEELDLRRPIYTPTSAYGHFGDPSFPWERTDRVDALAAAVRELA